MMGKRAVVYVLFALASILTVAVVTFVRGDMGGKAARRALNVEVEKARVVDSWADIPRKYAVLVEEGKLTILEHLVAVYRGSDVRVTTFREGNTIKLLEEEVLGQDISSKADMFKITEIIDTNLLPPGDYTVIAEKRSWNGSSGKWVSTTVLIEVVPIGR